ncbi:MAG TPA: AAA family ATPase [Gemmatimonas sp.]|uniref:AAA family ATPase n=1 Tax=Gemmatimonas sp. TaxID=1962908 RepID=UPI002ED7CF47
MPPSAALQDALAIVRANEIEKPDPLATRSLSDMLQDPALLAPAEWVLQPFFERGTLSSVYGPGKVGKSTMLADMAAHIARGQAWAGQRVAEGPVLWVDLEQGPRRLARTFAQLDAPTAARVAVWSDLGKVPEIGALRATIAALEPALVVIDSLGKFCQVDDENDNAAWQFALRPLEDLARSQRAAMVVIDHDRKGEGTHGRAMRGASSKLAAFDAAIHVQRGSTLSTRKLEMVSREIGDFTFVVDRTEDGYRAATSTAEQCKVLAALRALGDTVSVEVLHHHLTNQGYEMTPKTVRNRLRDAVAKGHATSTGNGTKNDPTLFVAATEEQGK